MGGSRGRDGRRRVHARWRFSAGATAGLPIRISPSLFGADEVLRFTFMMVPQIDFGVAGPVEGDHWQFQFGGGVGLRMYFDSTLLP